MSDALRELAAAARELAELADRYAERDPEQLAPTGEKGSPDRVDPFADLDRQARELVSAVAAARRAAWLDLRAARYTDAAIGRLWGIGRASVGKALKN